MSNAIDHPENLSVRARRNALLPGEQAEFDRLLEASPIMRLAHQLGADCDDMAALEVGDEQRVARFVDRALAARRPRRRRLFGPLPLSPWMAAAAVLAVCGAALGVRGVWWPKLATTPAATPVPASAARARPTRKPAPPTSAVTEPSEPPSAATTQSDQSVIEPALPPASAVQAVPANSVSVSAIRKSPASAPIPTPARAGLEWPVRKGVVATLGLDQPIEMNAAALLRQANSARMSGDVDRAVMLFNELQNKFPGSPQAHVSSLSLGKLLMLRGSPDAALRQFSSYLVAAGPLEEEALVGRAQALAALGRASEERRTWERLLARFPGSVYAAAARKRVVGLAQASGE